MFRWMKFATTSGEGFGRLIDDRIEIHKGDLFGTPESTGRSVALADVRVLPPCRPGKFIALWNNFYSAAEKNGWAIPAEPLFLLKASTSLAGPGDVIRPPASYDGRVTYEGELGIVIGRRARAVSAAEADRYILGYTCVNDVTALDLITRDASFAQWTRAKSCDGFGSIGPVIATGLDPDALVVRSLLNGRERQNYPVADAIFKPREIVARLSQEMTLEPGDVIAIGTSLGVLPMKPGSTIEIAIDGIGSLINRFEAAEGANAAA